MELISAIQWVERSSFYMNKLARAKLLLKARRKTKKLLPKFLLLKLPIQLRPS